jgi:hypothetical protein
MRDRVQRDGREATSHEPADELDGAVDLGEPRASAGDLDHDGSHVTRRLLDDLGIERTNS